MSHILSSSNQKKNNTEITDTAIVAMRGRNPKNPSSCTPGEHTEQRLEINTKGLSNTLTSVEKDNLLLEGKVIDPQRRKGLYLTNEKTVRVKQATKQGYIDCKIGGVADLSYPYSKTRRGRVQDNGDTSPTITATETGVCVIEDASKVYYRIRKLTPIECGRLMDVSDEDIAKIKAIGISDSQMYKLFGNSIVVGVMCHLFSQML